MVRQIPKSLYVREIPAGLDGKSERVRRLFDPACDSVASWKPIESRVDFDRVEEPRVVPEPPLRGAAWRKDPSRQ